jgi:hypothetical protein
MKPYRHSGTLGDLIYSLSIVKKLADKSGDPDVDFKVALNNIENCVSQYGYRPDEVAPEHRGRFTLQDYDWLRPLLERQSYIKQATTWQQGDAEPDVDLDKFRGTLFRGFEGNYVQAYHIAFGLQFMMQDYDTPWLEADAQEVAPIVVSRTSRYLDPEGDKKWADMVKVIDMQKNAIFVGTQKEHVDFQLATGTMIPYYPVRDFLHLANVVAGANLVCANQNFVFSLAMGLGKAAVLETIKIKPLQYNECFFPRTNINYI